MSFSTKPTFIHFGSWDDEMRSHPALKWMENYTKNAIDTRAWEKGMPATEYHTSDFTLQKSDGTVIKGAGDAWAALAQVYGPFAAHKHDPEFLVSWETSDGWGMMGVANLYFKLHGLSGDAITDPQGEKSDKSSFTLGDGMAPGAFNFLYVKEGNGIKLKQTQIFNDPSPAMKLMLQNKMISGEQLAGIVIGS